MTDKEKQILEIKDAIDSVYCGDCAYYGVDGFAIAEELYSRGYRKQVEGELISVDERLPYKKTMVLGFIHNVYADGSYWDNILVMELNSAGYFVPFNCSTIKDNRVTHWMPLPGAPKMKGGESDDRN